MKKKLLTLVVTAAMALSFAACGSNGGDSANAGNSSAAQISAEPSSQPSASAESSSAPAEDDTMTLEDWLKTDEAKQAEDATNSALASTGMSVKLAADGDIFVYEYTMPGEYSSLTGDALAAAFDPVIEANKAGVENLFETFESSYGIKLSAARFTFLAADGTELYSGDVANE